VAPDVAGNPDDARWSQSPIQRGWLCGARRLRPDHRSLFGLNPLSSGDGFVAPDVAGNPDDARWSQSPIQRGWLCGQIPADDPEALKHKESQSPIQRGWLCGLLLPLALLPLCLLWSQSPIQRGWLCGGRARGGAEGWSRVSIPYPAGMALWRSRSRRLSMGSCASLNPLSSGDGFVAILTVRTVFSHREVSLNPLSSGDGFVALLPSGGWPWPRSSQSPIQRGWLCGLGGMRSQAGRSSRCLNPLSSGDGFVARHLTWEVSHEAGLNPLSSGDGFVALTPGRFEMRKSESLNPLSSGDGLVACSGSLCLSGSSSLVSIPYPAGMALWPGGRVGTRRRRPRPVSIPYPAGMALWLPIGYSMERNP